MLSFGVFFGEVVFFGWIELGVVLIFGVVVWGDLEGVLEWVFLELVECDVVV